jgi:SAM-dependent methyltransferase
MVTEDELLSTWVSALEARHLADLRVQEMTRALRALSSAYVERRHRGAGSDGPRQKVRDTLDSRGKRAAFALFYAPLHFLAVTHVVRALRADTPPPSSILDLGCGTGAAGAAWALAAGSETAVTGIDRHPWAIDEARWTYQRLGVRGRARQGDITRVRLPRQGDAVIAAYVLNELAEEARIHLEDQLVETVERGGRVLIIEPIARGVAPWWEKTAARFIALGGRADQWRFPIDLPPTLQLFDKAAGLHHQSLALRSMFA